MMRRAARDRRVRAHAPIRAAWKDGDVHSYCISGLAVLSEIDLPGLIGFPAGQRPADVIIRQGPVPRELEGADRAHPTYQIVGDLFLVRVPGVARFLLRGGRELIVETENGTPIDDVAIFIIGTVFGILLHQREQIVLHASAIQVGGKAVLFCGPSGAGKSTMAAALGQRGYPLLTDDVCAIAAGEGQVPVAQPDGRQLKLWSQAIDELDLAARRGAPVRNRLEKFYVEPQTSIGEALPVAAVYILFETRPPHRDGIEKPNIVDAALLVRKNAYRPRLVRAMKQRAQYLQFASTIIAKAGVYLLYRPFDFAAFPDVVSRLETHWRELGLDGRPT